MYKFFVTFLFVSFVFIIASCHNTNKPVVSKEVHLYLQADPFSLDPRIGGDRRSQLLLRDLFEGLTRIGKNKTPELALADSVSISQDETVYTFHLHKAVWSNGTEITAEDFVCAIKTALNPTLSSPFAYAFFVIKNAKKAFQQLCSSDEIGIQAINAKTLEITLDHPTPYFLELLANPLFSPLPHEIVSKDSNWATKIFPHYVSNGPFVLKKREIKSQIILERNPLYHHEDKPKVPSLIYSIIEDPHTAYNMFAHGDLDWYGEPCGFIPLELISSLKNQKNFINHAVNGIYWIVCCTEKPHLSSPKIRQAISLAIKRGELCNLLLQGNESPAHSILPPSLSFVDQTPLSDDQQKLAKDLFEQGLQELNYTKATFPPLILTHWTERQSALVAEVIQQQLKQTLGITVLLDPCDWSTYMSKVPKGNIEIATAPWYSWVQDPMFNLDYLKFRNNGINGTCWQNPTYIHLLDQANLSLDKKERSLYLQQAEKLVLEELPLIPLYNMTFKYMKAPGLTGEALYPFGSIEMKWLEWETQKQ